MTSLPHSTPANCVPFPKSTSSPTISSSSQADSVSTWSSFSATTSHCSPPPPPPPTVAPATAERKVKHFGEGWLSNQSSQSTNLLSDPFPTSFPRRTRSPSVPILPSQLQPTPKRYDQGLQSLLDRMELASYRAPTLSSQVTVSSSAKGHTSFQAYQPRLHHEGSPITSEKRFSAQDGGVWRHLPILVETSPMLSHHQSVPNLSSSPRLRVNRQVRFPDELDEGNDDYGQSEVMGHGGSKLASTSMFQLSDLTKGKNIYISSVGPHLTEDHLNDLASRFGEVLSSRIQSVGEPIPALVPNGTLWQPSPLRRCAFVLFDKHEEAANFLKHLTDNGVSCDYGKEDFQVGWKSKEDRTSSNLYIQGLPLDTTSEELYALLAPYGRVVSSKFLESANRCRRGPALARLECRSQAIAAIKGLNHQPYPLDPKYILQVRIADSEEQKELKRKAGSISGYPPGDPKLKEESRRASMPVCSAISTEANQLESEKARLLDALREIEARQHRLAASEQYGHRSDNSSLSFPGTDFPISSRYGRPEYHRNLSTSTLRSDRTLSSTSDGSHIWIPSYPVTPSRHRRQDAMDLFASHSMLHHTTSTPDLGKKQLDPARMLWKDAENEL